MSSTEDSFVLSDIVLFPYVYSIYYKQSSLLLRERVSILNRTLFND